MMCYADIPQPAIFEGNLDEDLDVDSVVGDGHDPHALDVFQYIKDEIDLEVAIRERLATTIEGRIEWTLHMLDALSSVNESHDDPADEDDFQDAAFDALEALEAPSSFVFDTALPEERSPSPSISPIAPNQLASQRVPKTRSTKLHQKKYLYIKLSPSTSDSQLAILACPVCGKTQFTTLQGLLNHARLAHGIEWASHDACITACATLVSTDAENWETYESDGVEVSWSGNVAGLRRLFEQAVGVDGILPTTPLAHVTSDASLEISKGVPSTLLSRTLGLHADSPPLAQFLGRIPRRRCIHVHDEEQYADVTTLDDKGSQPDAQPSRKATERRNGFCMHFPHRSTARENLDLVVDIDTGPAEITYIDSTSAPVTIPAGISTSRFHITARIRLEDRSLFLKKERRSQLRTPDQYRWMLGVTAPSYSLPLTSFLTRLTVVPPRSVSPAFLTVQQQPFAIVGTANEPFMAKVVLEWVGGGKIEVEHWVELDQSMSRTSVIGSEQLLDLELDRNTPLLPVSKGNPPQLPSLDQRLTCDPVGYNIPYTDPEYGDIPTRKDEYYEQVLQSLLPRVPMTAKDVRTRATQVPYTLVASPTHLLALVPGRRKAIEWARARALHAHYVGHIGSVSPPRQTMLTVGDVYMFLEDNLHFPRPSNPSVSRHAEPKNKGKEKDGSPVLGDESCPTCGIKKRSHPGYDVKNEVAELQWTCAIVPIPEQRYGTRYPLANLAELLPLPDRPEHALQGSSSLSSLASSVRNPTSTLNIFLHTPRDLVALSPPALILAVHNVVSKLHLPGFPDIAVHGENPAYLASREHTEERLAPAALLSLILKPFISTLLQPALEIAKRDALSITPAAKNSRGKRMKKLTLLLSPGHLLRGLRLQPSNAHKATLSVPRTTMSSSHWERKSIALCLARLGVSLDTDKGTLVELGANSARPLTGHAAIKAEPE